MCDSAAPGTCALGTFAAGTLFASMFGLVSHIFSPESMGALGMAPGLAIGGALGSVAAAFPDGPPMSTAVVAVGAAAAGAVAVCAALGDQLLAAAVGTSAVTNAAMLASPAFLRRREVYYHQLLDV